MNDIQNRILDIFKEVSLICEKHKIPYYAIGGTCIGAVRHNGFIPWDDDIDIAIPIDFFYDFIEIAKNELPDFLDIYNAKNHPHNTSIHIKIVDNRTTFIENHEKMYPDSYKGVFVDIMPISGIPTGRLKRKVFYLFLKTLIKLNYIHRIKTRKDGSVNSAVKNMIHYILKPLPHSFFYDNFYCILKKNSFNKAQLTGYTWQDNVDKLTFPKKWFRDSVKLKFEDTYMKCPIDYDKYLSKQFGDYKKLPAIKDRISGHSGIIDLNVSYKEYIKKGMLNK